MSHVHYATVPDASERRRAPRFSLFSQALVAGEDGQMAYCTVENLSLGGALLLGRMPLRLGEAVRVVLPLPGGTPASMVGRVVRSRVQSEGGGAPSGARAYGVMFNGASARAAEQVHAALPDLHAAASRANRPAVLVVDANAAALKPTVAALSAGGHRAVAVTTAFDAIHWLLTGGHFAAAVVNPAPAHVDGPGLLHFLADEYPAVRRVAIHVPSHPAQLQAQLKLAGALSSADVARILGL